MDDDVKCPHCGSTDVLFSKKRQLHICEDCAHEFVLERPARKRRIFVSYGHDEHAHFAERLKKDLEKAGYAAWYDLERIVSGGDWERYIEEGLEWVSEFPGEGRFLLLMTPHSVRRPDGYCLNELSRANQRRLKIVPVMLVTADPPATIRDLKWLDMRGCLPVEDHAELYQAKVEALIRAVENLDTEGDLLPPEPAPTVETPPSQPGPTKAGKEPASKPMRIFIGCSPEQVPLASRIKDDLQERGFEVWFDGQKIGGPDAESYIEEGLTWAAEANERGRYLLLMAPSSVRRPDGLCLNELGKALMRKLTVVPVMISPCEPPLSICRVQWLDMQDCVPVEAKVERYRAKLAQLINALESDRIDIEGVHSKLMRVLEPMPFDADILSHVDGFTGRKAIFDAIDAWLADRGAPRTLWITGFPGSGKSAIVSWFAYHRPEGLAFHLCKFDDAQKHDPRRFVLSMAYQLSTQIPELQQWLGRLPLEGMIESRPPDELFIELIARPLDSITSGRDRAAAIVVDSLDEATTGDRNELAELFSKAFPKSPAWLRLIVASRRDPCLARHMDALGAHVIDLDAYDADADIREYVYACMGTQVRHGSALDMVAEGIADASEGNILFAECMITEIMRGNIAPGNLSEFPKSLGGCYLRFFRRQFPDLETYKTKVRPVLEVICAQAPVSIRALAGALEIGEQQAAETCDGLHNLFPMQDGSVQPFHRSLIDWLADPGRSAQYFVSANKGRRRLADYGMREYEKGVVGLPVDLLLCLPVHLARLERWEDVKKVMSDPRFIEAARHADEEKAGEYWAAVKKCLPVDLDLHLPAPRPAERRRDKTG